MADDSSSVDLMANTGDNSSSSPWNGLLQTALATGVSIGQDQLNKALNLQTPIQQTTPPPAAAAATPTAMAKATNYLPWIIGAVVLVVVGFFLVRE